MTHKIIKTDNYLLVVDDSEIKGWYFDTYTNKVKHSGGAGRKSSPSWGENSITKNIICHLPLNDSPILEGVPLLPGLQKNNIISDWLDQYGDPEIEKKVEERLEQITREENTFINYE